MRRDRRFVVAGSLLPLLQELTAVTRQRPSPRTAVEIDSDNVAPEDPNSIGDAINQSAAQFVPKVSAPAHACKRIGREI